LLDVVEAPDEHEEFDDVEVADEEAKRWDDHEQRGVLRLIIVVTTSGNSEKRFRAK
jgi:hypothetical protein